MLAQPIDIYYLGLHLQVRFEDFVHDRWLLVLIDDRAECLVVRVKSATANIDRIKAAQIYADYIEHLIAVQDFVLMRQLKRTVHYLFGEV